MEKVPHHLMGFIFPGEDYNVKKYVEEATLKIKEIHITITIPINISDKSTFLLKTKGSIKAANNVEVPKKLSELFCENVFSEQTMREYLTKEAFSSIMDAIKKGEDPKTAYEKNINKYGRFDEAVKKIDPRKE